MSNSSFVFLFVSFFLLFGCQSNSKNNFQSRNTEEYYQSTGGLDFLLAEAPAWANVVSEVGCFRNLDIRLLNLQKIRSEFNTSFRQTITIQYYYNQELLKAKSRFSEKEQSLSLKDFDLSFFKALEASKASFDPIRLPNFNRIHLIIYEDWIGGKNSEARLIDFLRNPIHNTGVPVIVSFCTPQHDLEQKFQELGAYSIGAEWIAPFNEDFAPKAGWSLILGSFVKAHQSVTLFKSEKNSKIDYSRILVGKYLINKE